MNTSYYSNKSSDTKNKSIKDKIQNFVFECDTGKKSYNNRKEKESNNYGSYSSHSLSKSKVTNTNNFKSETVGHPPKNNFINRSSFTNYKTIDIDNKKTQFNDFNFDLFSNKDKLRKECIIIFNS